MIGGRFRADSNTIHQMSELTKQKLDLEEKNKSWLIGSSTKQKNEEEIRSLQNRIDALAERILDEAAAHRQNDRQ
jgi:hypothetical protein